MAADGTEALPQENIHRRDAEEKTKSKSRPESAEVAEGAESQAFSDRLSAVGGPEHDRRIGQGGVRIFDWRKETRN